MTPYLVFLLGLGLSPLAGSASDGGYRSPASGSWSTEVHHRLLRTAFPSESEDCLGQMEAGSDWVDRFSNQGPDAAYQHAMRAPEEPIRLARKRMAEFIRSHYEQAAESLRANPAPGSFPASREPLERLLSCFHRGAALHPVMDTTSPAHEGFAIWSLHDLAGLLQHGDLPGSIENLSRFLESPDIGSKTRILLQRIDEVYLGLGFLDFQFENP